MKLTEYINMHYAGIKSDFAEACGVRPQQITEWVNKEFIVIEDMLYSPRRELPNIEEKE